MTPLLLMTVKASFNGMSAGPAAGGKKLACGLFVARDADFPDSAVNELLVSSVQRSAGARKSFTNALSEPFVSSSAPRFALAFAGVFCASSLPLIRR